MLGLNIVGEDEGGVTASTTANIGKICKPKKKNKYEKRRVKSRQAKLLKENRLNPSSEQEEEKELVDNDNEETSNTDTVLNDTNEEILELRHSTKNNHGKRDKMYEGVKNKASTFEQAMTSSIKSFDTETSRKRQQMKTEQLLQDEVRRAEYMSTFHARPYEMDRKSGAVSKIKESIESAHIFGKDEPNEISKNIDAHIQGSTCPFSSCGLHPNIIRVITSSKGSGLNLKRPTLIQRNAWDQILMKKVTKTNTKIQRKNLFIQSETGSGKTLAYLLPIIQQLALDNTTFEPKKVDRQLGGTRAIILCPTRELASQSTIVAEKVCQNSFPWLVAGGLSGGEKRKSEKARLRKGISILVATPGRLLDHLAKTDSLLMALKGKLEWVVLDESDRLLDLGLGSQVEQIMQMVRANQPKSGIKRDGITWQSILVSATINRKVEKLSSSLLGGDVWVWARFDKENNKAIDTMNPKELSNATPRQLTQHYMVVSSKLRLAALVAFLTKRMQEKERVVVFMSTCDSVDFHKKLFDQMHPIVEWDKGRQGVVGFKSTQGIFGSSCSLYRLHGNIPHNERNQIMSQFSDVSSMDKKAAVMITTDVAARGLNLPSVDWIVQYDPPCETNDYIHRAGRAARAGNAGHALLFLLPSEIQYVEVLKLRGLSGLAALSLSSTLQTAAKICADITVEGFEKAGSSKTNNANRMGEAFTCAVQMRLEDSIINDNKLYKESLSKKALPHGNDKADKAQKRKQRREAKNAVGPLLESARLAFSSYIRGYSTKEKCIKHLFSARALHLGHVAKSFALREQPKELLKSHRYSKQININSIEELKSTGRKRSSQLAFGQGSSQAIKGNNIESHYNNGKNNSSKVTSNTYDRNNVRKNKTNMLAAASRIEEGDMEFV